MAETTEPTDTENQVINENQIDDCKELLQQMATILQKIANALGVE